jgi:cobalt-precorrin-5B (C1)-methyltransferase
MIESEVGGLLPEGQGLEIVLSAPEGEERTKTTWNPRLGIEGGISILGTTGIVEPKSTAAYLASIDLYISSALAFDSPRPGPVFLVPGYVGVKCLVERFGTPRDTP